MESIAKEFAANQFQDLSNQPWYIRWGIAALGLISGIIYLLFGLTDLFSTTFYVGILEIIIGVILIAFEASLIAKAFSFEFCGVLITLSEKATPLIRVVLYGLWAVLIMIVAQSIGKIFAMIPLIATAAAYFVLWMGSRNQPAEGATSPTDFA